MSDEEKYLYDVPNWLLRNMFQPKGVALPQRKLLQGKMMWHITCGLKKVATIPGKRGAPPLLKCTACDMITCPDRCSTEEPKKHQPSPMLAAWLRAPAVYDGAGHGVLSKRERRRIRAGVAHIPIVRVDPEWEGNLAADEYRFWSGNSWTLSPRAQCRACKVLSWTINGRKEHKDKVQFLGQPCTRWLVNAYKALIEAGECVCCSTKTKQTVWGVPLCSLACQERWKYENLDWPKLRAALMVEGLPAEVGTQDWGNSGADAWRGEQ